MALVPLDHESYNQDTEKLAADWIVNIFDKTDQKVHHVLPHHSSISPLMITTFLIIVSHIISTTNLRCPKIGAQNMF